LRTRTLARLGVLVCIWTFAVMMLGGYTSALGAGLSCPDWPTCYGQWLPPFPSADNQGVDPETGFPVAYTNHQIMAEWVHRLIAALLGPFLIAFAWFAWREQRLPAPARLIPFAGCGILFLQYILGGLTVLRLSEPVLVTAHLGTATVFIIMMAVTTVLLYAHARDPVETDPETVPPGPLPAETQSPTLATPPQKNTVDHEGLKATMGKRRPDGVWREPLQAEPTMGLPMGTPGAPIQAPTGGSGLPALVTGSGLPLLPARSTGLRLIKDYVSMTKPRVMFLLVLTSLAAMFIATGGVPAVWPAIGVILGGALATGSSGAINHFLERDVDTRMARTADRPVAAGRISPAHALTFGITLGVLAFFITQHLANLLAAFFVMCGLFFYVFVYTMWLKRTTYLNIVIGGAAGGFPALVGWAAATNGLGVGAWLLFTLIIVWTPPHFWALALVLREDYAKANIPMLPVVKGIPRTTKEILVYSAVTVLLSFAFYALDVLGILFMIGAFILGGLLMILAIHLHMEPSKKTARALFGYSIIYLGLLYLVAFVEVLAF
jgi:heme o synthase